MEIDTFHASQYNFADQLEYDQSGTGLGFQYYFDKDSESIGSNLFYWGLGVNYSQHSNEIQLNNSGNVLVPTEFDLNLISTRLNGGIQWSEFSLEVPLIFAYSKETSGANIDDLKYGFGAGLIFRYAFYNNFNVALGYESLTFSKGKNASTGQEGSLANKVTMNNMKVSFGYHFQFGTSY